MVKQEIWLVLEKEWEWQYIRYACSTEQIAIRERDKLRSKIDKTDYRYDEERDSIVYERFEVITE